LVVGTLAIVMVGTPVVVCAVMFALGRPVRSAVGMGLALAQIGEFSFLVANLGLTLKGLPQEGVHALVAVAIITISVNPLLYRLLGPIDAWIAKHPRLARRLAARARLERVQAAAAFPEPRYRAVVVGFGPVGRTLVRLLREIGIEPTVIEMNLETARRLRGEGLAAVYGDAAHDETLKEAGLPNAGSLFLTASALPNASEVVRLARELNPQVRVVARASYLRERPELLKCGADAVFAGEAEIAMAMSESLLRELGATPDQIDRERDRVRVELFGESIRPTEAKAPPPETAAVPTESRPPTGNGTAPAGEVAEQAKPAAE
jgi:CPA2 family monovalent cation:H+ antiporter-2